MSDQATWDALSDLFTYPDAERRPGLESACLLLAAEGGALGSAASSFHEFLDSTSPSDCEELFTRTFDINPACSLELGWQLYGEEYSRGTFLVDMRQTMRALGVEETGELPDHLVYALRVLGRLVPFKAAVFSTTYIQPALEKMVTSFGELQSPWKGLLVALRQALELDFGAAVLPETVSTTSRPTPYDIPSSEASDAPPGCAPNACSPDSCSPGMS